MSFEPNLLNALVTIAFGALAGGITNAVAIWMLFHPYEPKGVLRLKIQGAIPKNKPRLAKTIGRTVGERLLTSDDLARQLSAPGLREAFDSAVRNFVVSMLETERGSLRDELPAGLLSEVETAFGSISPIIADRLVEFAGSEGFHDAVGRLQTKITEELKDRPLGEVLTAARRATIGERIETWVAEAVTNPELEEALGSWLDRQVDDFSQDRTPLLDRLPPALVAAVEKEIAGYLPLALDRISAVVGDPTARTKLQQSLHKLFEGFVKNLMLHERIVARLVVTEKTIDRLLENVERDGADQVAKLFEEPEMRSQVARSVNEAVVKFLRRPLAEHLDSLGHDRVQGLKATVKDHILSALRDGATRTYVIQKVDQALQAAENRTWGDILKHITPEDGAELASAALTAPRVRGWIVEGSEAAMTSLLDRPLGRPSELLPDGGIDRVSSALSPALWSWIQRQVPGIVSQLDIQTMVEEKVLGFSLERIEEIVRRTTQRELNVIVRLGYVLGAVVGAAAYVVSMVLN